MIDKQRRLLLTFLGFSLFACALAVYLFDTLGRLREVDERIAASRKKIERLQAGMQPVAGLQARQDRLVVVLKGEEARRYRPAEMDLYRFGLQVGRLLERHGLEVGRCIAVDEKPSPVLEYSVRGSILSFLRFLQAAQAGDHDWSLPLLSIKRVKEPGSEVDVVFRIGYEQIQ